MAGLLRLMIPPCPPVPLLGNHPIVGGCVAVALAIIRDRMAGVRDQLAERHSLPPDPATFPAEWSEGRKQDWLRSETGRHRDYLRLSAAVEEVEDALRQGEDLELVAVLFLHGRSEIEAWSGVPIVQRQFVWAECAECGQRYTPAECAHGAWSRVADPLAGIGGDNVACPAGHVIFAKQTLVA
jgi:hypothetical protein